MDIAEALYTTRAMRRVKPDPIPDEVQQRILDAAIGQLWQTVYKDRLVEAAADPDSQDSRSMLAVQRSAQWLADHYEDVPLFLFGFIQYDPTGGSIFPAVWSAQLAARAEGVGSALTAVLGIAHRQQVMDVLGVPADQGWHMSCCVSFGYPTGRWAVAPRTAAHEVAYRNGWGAPVGFEIPEPLWPAKAETSEGDPR